MAHPDSDALVARGVDASRIIGVLNKADAIADTGDLPTLRSHFAESVTVSAKTGEGLDRLAEIVVRRRSEDWCDLDLLIPHGQSRLTALAHQHGEVLREQWVEEGWRARVSVPRRVLWQLEPHLTEQPFPEAEAQSEAPS